MKNANTDLPEFDAFLLRHAAHFERMVNCELWLQAVDGRYYRPTGGWPVIYA